MADLKTHLALVDDKGRFSKFACGISQYAVNSMSGIDYTVKKEETTCGRCLNALVPKQKPIKIEKAKIWVLWHHTDTDQEWMESSKIEILLDAKRAGLNNSAVIRAIQNGEDVQINGKHIYRISVGEPV